MYRILICGLLLGGYSATFAGMNVLIEAESADDIGEPMRQVKAAEQPEGAEVLKDAAEDAYLEIPQGAGKPPEVTGHAVFKFSVDKSDRYYLWVRAWWLDGCGNSVGVSLDGRKEFTLGQDGTYKKWHWVTVKGRLGQLELNKGEHTLKLTNREDGIAIDQILLTRNKRYVPVGRED